MKILVIRFSSIGDIVLTTPVLRCIKQQKPNSVVHYLTKSTYRPLLAHNPYVDKFHYLENDLQTTIAELKKEKFDYVIDLHHNLRSLRVKRALKTKSFSFPKLNIQKWLLVNFKINLMPDKGIVSRYFKTVRFLGVQNDGQGLDYFVPEFLKLKNTDTPMSHWAGYVGCAIGGTHNTKRLPIEKWRELCSLIPYPVMLLGGPEDREAGERIAEMDRIKIYNACGKFNLNESALLVKYAKVIVSNDTGLMHVAAAYRKSIASLWGNTTPAFGMFPYYGNNDLKMTLPNSFILENKNLSCHPCTKIGYPGCPKKHFRCMNDLDMSSVADFVKKKWN
jgi:ADP-heptose:LPS heptosyltransferase